VSFKVFQPLMSIAALMGVFACGSPVEEKKPSRDLEAFGLQLLALDADGLVFEPTKIEGSGSFVLNQPLERVETESHFKVEGALEDGGSLELILFSTSQLKDGVSFRFSRRGDLVGLTIASEKSSRSWSDMIDLKDEGRISFSIDAHNQEQPIHFILWDGLNTARSVRDVLDSAEDRLNFGNGSGVFCGVKMEKAKVFSLTKQRAVRSHE